MDLLFGFNAVESALQGDRRTVDRVWVERSREGRSPGSRLARLRDLARRHGVPVEEVDRVRLDRMAAAAGAPKEARHQGVLASVAAMSYADPDEVLAACPPRATVLVADGVEDPRNLGALLRTAAGAGVSGVFIPERRAVGLSATVARAAAGALELVPVARIGNVASFLDHLKEEGFWTVGLDAGAPRRWDDIRYAERTALVIGGEGEGLRRLVRERCDELVAIPLGPGVESLNLSVAAGICLFEVVRQRRERG